MQAIVPNAPCGVESRGSFSVPPNFPKFLMHRVELKVCSKNYHRPCFQAFLMHRVELKDQRTDPPKKAQ